MIITRLELASWKRIRKLALDFEKGVNLLYGPNEIGKSSIIEAVKQAILGDAASRKQEYKDLQPWGTDVKAKVKLFFTDRAGKLYTIEKSFPQGNAALYLNAVPLTEDPPKTQEKLFEILDIPGKAAQLFDLLFIDQGQALNIFDKDRKKNPMSPETRSYIQDVIKETALSTLRDFEAGLARDRELLFTNPDMKKFKRGKDAPPYIRLLEREKEENENVIKFQEKMDEFSRQLAEMEQEEDKQKQLSQEKESTEKRISLMEAKESKLAELENKRLAFKPIEQDYERFLQIDGQLQELGRDLPRLYAQAAQIGQNLEKESDKLTLELKEKQQYKTALKSKKEKCEFRDKCRQRFETIDQDFRKLGEIDENIKKIDQELPPIFALSEHQARQKAEENQAKIEAYLKKQAELNAVETQLTDYPPLTREHIDEIRNLDRSAADLQSKLAQAGQAVQMKFEITPHPEKEIEFQLKLDDGQETHVAARTPVIKEDFRRLQLRYPPHFDIEFHGQPRKVDIPSLQDQYKSQKEELANRLSLLKADTIETLEKKFSQYCELKSARDNMQSRLQQYPKLEELEREKQALQAEIISLRQEIEKHGLKDKLPDISSLDESLASQTAREIRERLATARARREALKDQYNQIIGQRIYGDFEKEHKAKEKEYREIQAVLENMEPKELREVTPDILDKIDEEIKKIENNITAKENDQRLLREMEFRPEFQPQDSQTNLLLDQAILQAPQQTRDAIKEKLTLFDELAKQRGAILEKRKCDGITEALKDEFDKKKEEITGMARFAAVMSPIEMETIEAIKSAIDEAKKEIRRCEEEIKKCDNKITEKKTRLSGYSEAAEELNRAQSKHRQTLEEIKIQLTDIYALKLLFMLIAREKEIVQREIFKPLEERIIESFAQMIPGERYKLGISDELEIALQARGLAGDFLQVDTASISYGTKEQLSFLFRLAVARQLSHKEGQVMILDDSFVNTDNDRLSHIIEMIERSAAQIQFLIFTCRQEDYTRYRGAYNVIDLQKLIDAE